MLIQLSRRADGGGRAGGRLLRGEACRESLAGYAARHHRPAGSDRLLDHDAIAPIRARRGELLGRLRALPPGATLELHFPPRREAA